MSAITLAVRWREEMVASCDEGALVFEFTMGRYHLYFPTEARWASQVPGWAKPRWREFLTACEQWCAKERVPISLVDDAHVGQG